MPINAKTLAAGAIFKRALSKKKKGGGIQCGEVVDVILDDSHPSYDPEQEQMQGSCKVRILPDNAGSPPEDCQWYRPLSTLDIEVPLIGEIVNILQGASKNIKKNPKAQQSYYTKPIAIYQELHNNNIGTATGFTSFLQLTPTLGEYTSETLHYPFTLFEGDKILAGRYGQCIRFSTAADSSPKHYWSQGKSKSPVLLLSNGNDASKESHMEKLDKGSHIAMTKGITIDGKFSTFNDTSAKKQPNKFKENQIILTSDRIVLEANTDAVLVGSKKAIGISTPEWKADFTTMMDLLKELISEVEILSKGTFPTGVGPTGPHPSVPAKIADIKTKFGELEQ